MAIQELVERRSYSRKTFLRDDGKLVSHCHIGHIHFKDDITGQLRDVDFTWEDAGTHWILASASYRLRVAKNFSAVALIEFQNKYEGAAHVVTYDPRQIVWLQNRTFASATVISNQQNVTGVVTGSTIRYTGAFGPGIHFEITLQRSGFRKEVVIDSLAALGAPPTGTAGVALLFRYGGQGLTVTDEAGQVWNGVSLFERSGRLRLIDAQGRPTFVAPAMAFDAGDRQLAIPVGFVQRPAGLFQVKFLSRAVIDNAVYPLRADTTTQFYAGAGDGNIISTANATWDASHDATTGTANAISLTERVSAFAGGVNYFMRRMFFPVDTSGIPDTDTIVSATFWAKSGSTSYSNTDDDGDDWLNIVGPTTQADPTTLANGDYDQCGAIDNPTELSDTRRDISGISSSTYYDWVLNAAGLAAISKTGYTLLGLREGHDIIDSAIQLNTDNTVRFNLSEQTGTGDDPYLEVVHAGTVMGRPLVNAGLISRGLVNAGLVN